MTKEADPKTENERWKDVAHDLSRALKHYHTRWGFLKDSGWLDKIGVDDDDFQFELGSTWDEYASSVLVRYEQLLQ